MENIISASEPGDGDQNKSAKKKDKNFLEIHVFQEEKHQRLGAADKNWSQHSRFSPCQYFAVNVSRLF